MTRIVSACALLNRLRLPADDEPGWTPVMRERPAGERERWWQQIDDATRWLIDGGLLRLRLLVHLDGAACSPREAFAFDTDSCGAALRSSTAAVRSGSGIRRSGVLAPHPADA
ncbi:hypothetical protein GCM10010300_72210 [Streptomyces olivaceoviridis]|uniref:hypothetical protein n=1 Tax=Streptomyces olivaceoviridis TaxID=1921 RepID=UPI00167517BB|nr:hypothetical protein [Streptomyces olivaceoviridis]GGZ17738.1 hypothetical protein GCM10010300_72210 [Streptomyces olivaceoviridis]